MSITPVWLLPTEDAVRTQRSIGVGLGMAVLSASTFGTSRTFARSLINAGWTAETAVVVRIGIAGLILAIPTVWAMRGRWPSMRRSLGTVGVFGVLAVAGAQLAFFKAILYVPVGVALLLEYSGIL